jgi:hypothetical protein
MYTLAAVELPALARIPARLFSYTLDAVELPTLA